MPEREKASCSRRGGSEKAVALTSAGHRPNPENESIKGVEYWKCHRSDWLDLDVELMLPAGVPQCTTSENLKAEVLPTSELAHPHPALCTAGTGTIPDSLCSTLMLSRSHLIWALKFLPSMSLLCTCAAPAPGQALPLQAYTPGLSMASSSPQASSLVLLFHPLQKSQRDPSRT